MAARRVPQHRESAVCAALSLWDGMMCLLRAWQCSSLQLAPPSRLRSVAFSAVLHGAATATGTLLLERHDAAQTPLPTWRRCAGGMQQVAA